MGCLEWLGVLAVAIFQWVDRVGSCHSHSHKVAQTASEDAQRQPMLHRLHVLLGEEPIPHMYYYIQEQWQWYEEYHDEYEWFWTTMPHNSNLNGKHHASKLM